MHTLLTPNEITLTAEADKQKVDEILAGLSGITDLTYPENQESEAYTTVRIKTDMKEIYDMSRQLFKAFAGADIVLLEMALKQVNLEDVFIELTEDTSTEGTTAPEATDSPEVPEAPEVPEKIPEESEVEADDSSIEA